MAEGFLAMLQGIVMSPSTHITRLPCLSVSDKQLLQEFNSLRMCCDSLLYCSLTNVILPAQSQATVTSLHELFHLQAKKTPLAAAFVQSNGRKYTYNEWDILNSVINIIISNLTSNQMFTVLSLLSSFAKLE
jgi:non-ribosomal peptide synthetase component F